MFQHKQTVATTDLDHRLSINVHSVAPCSAEHCLEVITHMPGRWRLASSALRGGCDRELRLTDLLQTPFGRNLEPVFGKFLSQAGCKNTFPAIRGKNQMVVQVKRGM